MDILKEGKGELLGWHDPDEARKWVLENKPRELTLLDVEVGRTHHSLNIKQFFVL